MWMKRVAVLSSRPLSCNRAILELPPLKSLTLYAFRLTIRGEESVPVQIVTKAVVVSDAGTPVQPYTDTSIQAQSVLIQNTHATLKMYVGLAGMDKSTLENVIAVIAAGAMVSLPNYAALNVFQMADLYIDAENDDATALLTYFVA